MILYDKNQRKKIKKSIFLCRISYVCHTLLVNIIYYKILKKIHKHISIQSIEVEFTNSEIII